MDSKARKALDIIRAAIAADRFIMLPHFRLRMTQRGLVWPDILAVLDGPAIARSNGMDTYGRNKWIVAGTASDGLAIDMVCVLDTDDRGRLTVLITIY